MKMHKTIGALPIALLWSTSALAGGGWTISESTGQVSVTRAGISKVALKGGALAFGDIIATGAKSRAILVRGEEYLVVSPGSRLKIAAPERDGLVTQIIEEAGTVLFKIKKKMTPHFGVQTPYLAAVVKGTTFSVTVTDKGASVQVTEGAVEVGTLDGGVSDLVKPGIIAYVSASDKYRMTVEGDTVKTLDSPNRGSKSEPAKADTVAVLEADPASPVFETAIAEDPKPISEITDGLITGIAGAGFDRAAAQVAAVDAVLSAPKNLAQDVMPVQAQPVEMPTVTAATESVPTSIVVVDLAPNPATSVDTVPPVPVETAIAPTPQPTVPAPTSPAPIAPAPNSPAALNMPAPSPTGPVAEPAVITNSSGGLSSNIGGGNGNSNMGGQNNNGNRNGAMNNTGANNNGGGNNVGGQNINGGGRTN